MFFMQVISLMNFTGIFGSILSNLDIGVYVRCHLGLKKYGIGDISK